LQDFVNFVKFLILHNLMKKITGKMLTQMRHYSGARGVKSPILKRSAACQTWTWTYAYDIHASCDCRSVATDESRGFKISNQIFGSHVIQSFRVGSPENGRQ
jgi:hypothetical protein